MQVRKHVPTIAIAMVVAAVTAGAPAIAHGVQHALFAHKAGVANNAKKLGRVAPKGYWKKREAVNAKTLGGKTASQFLPNGDIKIAQGGPFMQKDADTTLLETDTSQRVDHAGTEISYIWTLLASPASVGAQNYRLKSIQMCYSSTGTMLVERTEGYYQGVPAGATAMFDTTVRPTSGGACYSVAATPSGAMANPGRYLMALRLVSSSASTFTPISLIATYTKM